MLKISKFHLFYLIIPFILIIFHYDLLIKDTILLRDDVLLVSAVDGITSLKDYVSKILEGALYDIQPVRDLTFYINLKFYHAFGYGGFHLFNIFLMLIILYVFKKNAMSLGLNNFVIFMGLTFVAVHPVFNTSGAWVSNRKHLLSILFISLYVSDCLKENPSGPRSLMWVLLSFLSQPITLFIPVGWILYKRLVELKKIFFGDKLIIFLSFVVLISNYYFYNSNIRFAGRNAVDAYNSDIGTYILKLARVPVQLFMPLSFAVEYNPGNILNFVGIVLSVILLYLYNKFSKEKKEAFIILIGLTTLFPVIKWGGRDAYLLVTLLMTGYLFMKITNRLSRKVSCLISIPIFLYLGFYSYKFTNMWKHDVVLHKMSHEIEGGAENFFRYANVLAIYDPEKAYDIYGEAIKVYPHLAGQVLFANRAEALFKAPNLTDQKKLEKFRSNQNPDIFSLFFEIKLLEKLQLTKEVNSAKKALIQSLNNAEYRMEFYNIMCLTYHDECKNFGLLK